MLLEYHPRTSENFYALVLQDECSLEIFLSPGKALSWRRCRYTQIRGAVKPKIRCLIFEVFLSSIWKRLKVEERNLNDAN
ncbi:hypothetical protein DPMN_061354 [Dreissena polymorpha]|uniref:Uncharacterized protein n=1 Tax=Dreissena polymorpha TaxID=45954 RepID=A0A9D4HIB8_DREPO|nr:hypothetical protein DPMN_061354 [Dreissena polymorpha]